ncbi:MAG: LamG domain-containing protein [Planctomycetota bacterium]|nr:LamG domain-containing protein [Planctomycetota bacterium]
MPAPEAHAPKQEEKGYRGPLMVMTGDEAAPVKVWNAQGEPVFAPYYAFAKKGLGLIDRNFGCRMEGGCYFSAGAEEVLGAGLDASHGEFSLSVCLEPRDPAAAGEGCIIGYGPEGKPARFALTQRAEGYGLTLGEGAGKAVRFKEKPAAKPVHLVVTSGKHEITLYVNGVKSESLKNLVTDLPPWGPGLLWIGNDGVGAHPWLGQLERVMLYNKTLTSEEAKALADAFFAAAKERPPVERVEFKGTLLAQSDYPKPWDEGFTYRDVLSVREYKVDEVVHGTYKGKKIRVAEWAYVDRIFLANSQKKIGQACRLVVEPLDANPQLSTIQRGDTLEMDLDAEVFYDLTPMQALPEDQQPKPPGSKTP